MKQFIHSFKVSTVMACSILMAASINAVGENIITAGTTVKIMPGTAVVSVDNMVIQSGATLDNSGTVILKKNLVNEYTSPNSIGSGITELSGTTGQVLSGKTIFSHVTVNNPAGITIGGETRINGTLTLSSGCVTLGNNNLVLGPLGTFAGAHSVMSMIIPTGSGELRKMFSNTGNPASFTFPVGDKSGASEYSPVTLDFLVFIYGNLAADNYIGVSLRNEKYPDAAITGNYLNRYWKLTQTGIYDFLCNVTFQYTAADVTGSEELISCTRVNPLPWTTYALTNSSGHLLTAAGISSFSTFTGMKSTTAPENQNIANATIPAGITNCYDAQQILTVAGNGGSFVVENGGSVSLVAGLKISMLPGVKVNPGGYLLATISSDFCGSLTNPLANNPETTSGQMLAIDPINRSAWIRIYPNPTHDLVFLEFEKRITTANVADIVIYNIQGKAILERRVTNSEREQFSLAGLPVGMYLIRVQTETGNHLAKIVRR